MARSSKRSKQPEQPLRGVGGRNMTAIEQLLHPGPGIALERLATVAKLSRLAHHFGFCSKVMSYQVHGRLQPEPYASACPSLRFFTSSTSKWTAIATMIFDSSLTFEPLMNHSFHEVQTQKR
jgi:hypothetical protein